MRRMDSIISGFTVSLYENYNEKMRLIVGSFDDLENILTSYRNYIIDKVENNKINIEHSKLIIDFGFDELVYERCHDKYILNGKDFIVTNNEKIIDYVEKKIEDMRYKLYYLDYLKMHISEINVIDLRNILKKCKTEKEYKHFENKKKIIENNLKIRPSFKDITIIKDFNKDNDDIEFTNNTLNCLEIVEIEHNLSDFIKIEDIKFFCSNYIDIKNLKIEDNIITFDPIILYHGTRSIIKMSFEVLKENIPNNKVNQFGFTDDYILKFKLKNGEIIEIKRKFNVLFI